MAKAKLDWSTKPGSVGTAYYNIYMSNDDGVSFDKVDSTSGKSRIISGLVKGTKYTFQVSVVGKNGTETLKTERKSFVISLLAQATRPPDISNLGASQDDDFINLDWDAVNIDDLKYYEVRRGSDWAAAKFIGYFNNNYCREKWSFATTVTYHVKALDKEEYASENPASITVTIKDYSKYITETETDFNDGSQFSSLVNIATTSGSFHLAEKPEIYECQGNGLPSSYIAAVFDGASSQYAEAPDHATLNVGNEDFIISFWIRSTDDNFPVLYKSEGGVGSSLHYAVFIYTGGIAVFHLSGAGPSQSGPWNTDTLVNDGVPHHVACVADKSARATVYVDGLPDNVGDDDCTQVGNLDNTNNLRVARYDTYYADIEVADIRLYKCGVDGLPADIDAAIWALYRGGPGCSPDELSGEDLSVHYFPGTISNFEDQTDNGNDLTTYNGPTFSLVETESFRINSYQGREYQIWGDYWISGYVITDPIDAGELTHHRIELNDEFNRTNADNPLSIYDARTPIGGYDYHGDTYIAQPQASTFTMLMNIYGDQTALDVFTQINIATTNTPTASNVTWKGWQHYIAGEYYSRWFKIKQRISNPFGFATFENTKFKVLEKLENKKYEGVLSLPGAGPHVITFPKAFVNTPVVISKHSGHLTNIVSTISIINTQFTFLVLQRDDLVTEVTSGDVFYIALGT